MEWCVGVTQHELRIDPKFGPSYNVTYPSGSDEARDVSRDELGLAKRILTICESINFVISTREAFMAAWNASGLSDVESVD